MSNAKILTVDDSNLSRKRFIAQPLRQAGYEVVEAVNGEEGLKAVEEHQPDVIVSDLLMPIMDGFEFVEALSKRGVTTPIIVVSADIQESSREKIDQFKTFGFLNKPFKPEVLLEAVQQALESVGSEVATCN